MGPPRDHFAAHLAMRRAGEFTPPFRCFRLGQQAISGTPRGQTLFLVPCGNRFGAASRWGEAAEGAFLCLCGSRRVDGGQEWMGVIPQPSRPLGRIRRAGEKYRHDALLSSDRSRGCGSVGSTRPNS